MLSVHLRRHNVFLLTTLTGACSEYSECSEHKCRRLYRYGKPMIIDLMDTSLWGEVHGAFDAIDGGLMDTILSKGILEKVHYMKLVREEDGEQFKDSCFQAARLEAFKFIVLTAVKAPCEEMLSSFCALQVEVGR